MFSIDVPYIFKAFTKLVVYLPITLKLVFWSLLFGFVFGVLLTKAKLSKNKLLRTLAYGYTGLMRSTPTIILLFVVFYGIPPLFSELFNLDISGWSRDIFCIITFSLFGASSISEIIRPAYESVDKGQREAALSIGQTELQAFFRVILPQTFLVALPGLGNNLINLIKEAALAFTIGTVDIMGEANVLYGLNYGSKTLEIYIAVSMIYWALSIIIDRCVLGFEKLFAKGRSTRTIKKSQ